MSDLVARGGQIGARKLDKAAPGNAKRNFWLQLPASWPLSWHRPAHFLHSCAVMCGYAFAQTPGISGIANESGVCGVASFWTHKPLVGSSTLPAATSLRPPANAVGATAGTPVSGGRRLPAEVRTWAGHHSASVQSPPLPALPRATLPHMAATWRRGTRIPKSFRACSDHPSPSPSRGEFQPCS